MEKITRRLEAPHGTHRRVHESGVYEKIADVSESMIGDKQPKQHIPRAVPDGMLGGRR